MGRQAVRTKSLTLSNEDKLKFNAPTLAKEIMADFTFKTFRDTKSTLIYNDGLYLPLGESFIEQEVGYRLDENCTEYRVKETKKFIKISTYVDRDKFNNSGTILNLKNGLLNINTLELKPHTSNFLSTIRIPVSYDPNADCPVIKKFFSEIVDTEYILVLEEIPGYCLDTSLPNDKAILLIGGGLNGKSTYLQLIGKLLGEENTSHVALQMFGSDRFATADLYGRLANIYADLPSAALKDTGMFKVLTGADRFSAQEKFEKRFNFINFAKFIFSANKPPLVRDDTLAFWRRWIILDFPNEFSDEKGNRDRHLLAKMTTPGELSGLLNLALAGLKRIHQNGGFSCSQSPEEVQERYSKAANPVYAFVEEKCELDSAAWISKDDLYKAFEVFCQANGIPTILKKGFGHILKISYGSSIKDQRQGDIYGWQGIKLKDVGTVGTV